MPEDKKKNEEKTVQEVIDSMTEEQKQVLYFLIAAAAENNKDTSVAHNIFNDSDEGGNEDIYQDEDEQVPQEEPMPQEQPQEQVGDGESAEEVAMHAQEVIQHEPIIGRIRETAIDDLCFFRVKVLALWVFQESILGER